MVSSFKDKPRFVGEKVRLGDVLKSSSTRNKDNHCVNVYSVTNSKGFVPSEEYFSKEVFSKELKTYRVVARDMIAYNPSRINVGSVALQDKADEVVVSPLYVVFSTDRSKLIPEYLVHFLKSKPGLGQIAFQSIGTVRNNLKFKALCQMELSIPSLEEQEARLKTLREIQLQITQAEAQIEKLEHLVKSRFVEMFELEQYLDVHLGELVKTMHIGPFGSAMKNEVFVDASKASCVVYEQKHAIKKSISLHWRFVDANKHAELKRFEAGPGTILVSCRGTIGEVYQLPTDAPIGIIHPSLMKIDIDETKLDATYFAALLESIFKEAAAKAEGSGVKMAIKAKELAQTSINYPPLALQREFATFTRQVDKPRFAILQQIEKLETLKASLMQEYFG